MLSLDPTTRAEYVVAGTAADKAQVVLAALAAPVYVRVYNASDTLMGSGQMATTWATRSGNVLTIGELATFTVSQTGTPAAGWYLRFESGSRYLQGTFGPGGDFTWSLPTWETGQLGVIGTATVTAATGSQVSTTLSASYTLAGATISFGWTISDVPWPIGTYTAGVGGTYELSQHAYTAGSTPVYTVVTGPANVTVDQTTGLLTIPASLAAADSYTVSVSLVEYVAPPAGVTDATAVIPQDVAARPSVGQSVTQPAYGTTITRVTSNGTSIVQYPQLSAWNSDESLLYVNGGAGTVGNPGIYNGQTYAFISFADLYRPNEWAWRWSPSEPNVLYCCANDQSVASGVDWGGRTPHNNAVFMRLTLNPSTGAVTRHIVASWPTYRRAVKDPSWEQVRVHPTTADLWVGLCLEVSTGGPFFAVGVNITQSLATGANVGTSLYDLSPAGPARDPAFYTNPPYRVPDHVTITPKCDAMVVAWGADSVYGGGTRWRGFEKYDMSWNFLRQFNPSSGHGDYLVDTAGVQWHVCHQNGNTDPSGMTAYKIDGSVKESVRLLDYITLTNYRFGTHTSARATPRDWVIVSSDWEASGPRVPYEQEVFALYLSSRTTNRVVRRLFQNRCTNSTGYRSSACVSPSGTRIAFSSDWETGGGTDVYVAEVGTL